ncbi:uncharacterized protein LOC123723054 [Papilio machaon]|uniref:uncharacterized protein LOC123723052 n=1 Tax=Papilio machaon TaxID=76193 RepID=UPI001E665EAC|nr:uncharacterized protein LOC123723052 [Papilio machaon]XP_045541550.1 uncharacterized protein LOC123723053 [Papilio machaon]XP_045541551.1 uncharacterized protein LOC123723054 [Papilio machaon]
MSKRSAEEQIIHYERKIRKLRERKIGRRRRIRIISDSSDNEDVEVSEQGLAPQITEPEPDVEPEVTPDPELAPDLGPLPDTRDQPGDPELDPDLLEALALNPQATALQTRETGPARPGIRRFAATEAGRKQHRRTVAHTRARRNSSQRRSPQQRTSRVLRQRSNSGVSEKTVTRITKEGITAASTSKKIVTPGKSRPHPKKFDFSDHGSGLWYKWWRPTKKENLTNLPPRVYEDVKENRSQDPEFPATFSLKVLK